LILITVLILLFIIGLRLDQGEVAGATSPQISSEFNPPLWVWIVFTVLGLLLRFGLLTSFEGWPGGDEALQGVFALELNRHWTWRVFYATGQDPPFWMWLLSLFYRFSSNTAFNLWFPPALVSTLFVGVSTLAVRRFFSKGMSFPFFLSLSVGFWPFYFGRFCVQGVLVPLFEAIAFLVLGYLWNAEQVKLQKRWSIVLGVLVGAGAYTYPGFLSVIMGVSLAVLVWAWGKSDRRLSVLLYFSVLFVIMLPFGWAIFNERVGGYVLSCSPLGGLYAWKDEFLHSASYITTLFWGPIGSGTDFGPVWGGFLNPVETSFFILGLLKIGRLKNKAPKYFLGAFFFLFLLPGLLTADQVEMLRVIPVMPVLYVISCAGFLGFWCCEQSRGGRAVLISLIALSVSLNLFHLAKVRSLDGPLTERFSLQERTNDGYWAYRRLLETSRTKGPGLVFSDFLLLDRDTSLHVMSYPFNALLNPHLDIGKAQWAGVQTNVHYGDLLQKRFPDSRWRYVTPPGENPARRADGGSVVGIIPITPENRKIFIRWAQAHDYFRELGFEAQNTMNNQELYTRQVEKLPAGYALMEGDPFLESVYGEWVAQYHIGPNLDPNVKALERALRNGYPTANLYFKLGNFLTVENKMMEAERAFAQATQCQPDLTQAALYLRALQIQAGSK
jgi:hypothetical protein